MIKFPSEKHLKKVLKNFKGKERRKMKKTFKKKGLIQ